MRDISGTVGVVYVYNFYLETEYGIRGLCLSRGVGDVYEGQHFVPPSFQTMVA